MTTVGAHGQGGVTKRGDGRLQVSITLTSGKRVYRTIPRFSDPKRQQKLAEAARRELVAMREAEIDPSGQLLRDFLHSWLRDMASATHARLRPNTLAFYRIMAERHVIPALGDHPIEGLRERHVQAWLDGLRLSPQYVSHCRAFLRRVLNVAYRQRLITRNPAIGVELPKIPKYRAATMTNAEVRALFAATATDRLAALWRLAAMTGLRSGELAALSWDDVDTEAGLVRVTATLGRRAGEYVRAEPKADRSLERIAIDRETVTVLEAHRKRQAAERTAEWRYWGLVFTTPAGMPLDRATMLAAFHEACDRAGIARRRVHDIRGTNASLMRDIGVEKETRKARLGHSSDEAHDRYAKASGLQDRDAVNRLAESLG